ncbi:NAD-dependent epimerase [Pantoea sp. Nvir]|uniref:NAD-dependent epimerase n=1 Tax=Pantoea sp. Nvir TaxID=2576760 RepID=UPI00135A59C1|nr:NAD-dependent epimerase [Pantoea sp. Nvir]MXP66690.1 NAD-dependent epimerase [Pantoea sp. Nvir]
MNILVTGAAGFIGFHVSQRLLTAGHHIVGLDNLNDYYDVKLKQSRLGLITQHPSFTFIKMDLSDRVAVASIFSQYSFKRVIHLGAQAGVRYSIDNPHSYADTNLIGHLNILEGCRCHKIEHLLYASSSSVYGLNRKIPFSTNDRVDHPVSLYAATKKANELMSHTYSHLYQLPTTGLRFFTVYGPWGRPDMALFKFTRAIIAGEPIDVYNCGEMKRDFTYIDDVTEAIVRLQNIVPQPDQNWTAESGSPATSSAPYRVYNIGNSQPISLMKYIEATEKALGIKAKKNMLPMQPGDLLETSADTKELYQAIGFKPHTNMADEGVTKFVRWYRGFYNV